MTDDSKSSTALAQPWPKEYPRWYIEIIESSMEETGMSREEAEKFLEFELMFGGSLMQGYVAKLKAHQKETKGSTRE